MTKIQEQARELRKLWGGFQATRVIITANSLNLFDHLEQRMTASGLAKKIKTDRRATEILLDALSGLGLISKKAGNYKNTGTASRLLVSTGRYYQGDIIRHIDVLWDNWSNLEKVVKKGRPYHKTRNHQSFIMGMHNLSVIKAEEIINAINLRGVHTALDLGGGPGTYTMELAKKGIRTTLFDLPETIKIAKKVVRNEGVDRKNIHFKAGEFLADDIGKGYDLILISQVLHMFSEKVNINLLRKCRKALNPKGQLVIQEFPVQENKTSPVSGALFAVNMLVNTEGGRTYSAGDIKRWFGRTGFGSAQKKNIADAVLVSARRA